MRFFGLMMMCLMLVMSLLATAANAQCGAEAQFTAQCGQSIMVQQQVEVQVPVTTYETRYETVSQEYVPAASCSSGTRRVGRRNFGCILQAISAYSTCAGQQRSGRRLRLRSKPVCN